LIVVSRLGVDADDQVAYDGCRDIDREASRAQIG
jgi:hypothetical protein